MAIWIGHQPKGAKASTVNPPATGASNKEIAENLIIAEAQGCLRCHEPHGQNTGTNRYFVAIQIDGDEGHMGGTRPNEPSEAAFEVFSKGAPLLAFLFGRCFPDSGTGMNDFLLGAVVENLVVGESPAEMPGADAVEDQAL